jgi:hypothetical protein
MVVGQSGPEVHETPILINKQGIGWECNSVVKCLPSMHEALGCIPSNIKNNNNNNNKKTKNRV